MVGKTGNSDRIRTNLLKSSEKKNENIQRLASGKKVNKASDNPAALAMIMAMESQTRGLQKQISNRLDEISLMQTAEDSLDVTGEMLQRINELSVQASNGTLTDNQRKSIQFEIDQLSQQIDMTADNTTFNTKNLLDGSLKMQLQGGDNLEIEAMNSQALGISGIDVTTQSGAQAAISRVSSAISQVTSTRSSLGSIINGVTHQVNNLNQEFVNTIASQSRIQDTDMAAEIIKLNNNQIMTSANLKVFNLQEEARKTVLSLIS